ncbi:MAG: ornithine decarboxylase [Pseudomonadota bacterium]
MTTRSNSAEHSTFRSAADVAHAVRPDVPIYCFRPEVLKADARCFLQAFPGKTAYAVKTNGQPMVLDALVDAGVRCFDVASPAEFASAVAAKPDAELLYMHPVKSKSDIRVAIESYRIRAVAADHEAELAKILRVVEGLDLDPGEITVFIRFATRGEAAYELSKKFGAAPGQAAELLQRVHRYGFRAGLCFHVGSQVEELSTFNDAIATAASIRKEANVPLDALDIGGGFPATYAGVDSSAPEVEAVMDSVNHALKAHALDDLPLVAEPGRVIVARCLSVLVRVLLRKGRRIYINDGIWSSLSDSWTGKITLPARFIPDPANRQRGKASSDLVPFRVCGATCDSVDVLSRPFHLPDSVDTGDWIEIGHIGAYSLALRTRFNGFYPDTFVEVTTPFEDGEGQQGTATLETMGDVPTPLEIQADDV